MVFVRPVAKLWREETKIGQIFQHRVPAQILQDGFCTPPWWDFVRPPCEGGTMGGIQWGGVQIPQLSVANWNLSKPKHFGIGIRQLMPVPVLVYCH